MLSYFKKRYYLCVKLTQINQKPLSRMNIMNYLGFSKKGAETKAEAKEEKNHGFQFSDKYPREEGETRI